MSVTYQMQVIKAYGTGSIAPLMPTLGPRWMSGHGCFIYGKEPPQYMLSRRHGRSWSWSRQFRDTNRLPLLGIKTTFPLLPPFVWPCVITNFFIIKPTRCINFANLFCAWNSTFRTVPLSIIRSLLAVHSAMVYVIQVGRQLSTNLYDIYH